MKKLLIISAFLFCYISKPAYCNTVYLVPNEIYLLDVPQPKEEIAEEANDISETDLWDDETRLEMYSEEDFAQNKFEKKLCKFINNRVRNKKLNLFSAPIGPSPNSGAL